MKYARQFAIHEVNARSWVTKNAMRDAREILLIHIPCRDYEIASSDIAE